MSLNNVVKKTLIADPVRKPLLNKRSFPHIHKESISLFFVSDSDETWSNSAFSLDNKTKKKRNRKWKNEHVGELNMHDNVFENEKIQV